jgi:prevent-host-death family protein
MNVQRISLTELHNATGETVARVHFTREPIIVENRNRPWAAIVPVMVDAETGEMRLAGEALLFDQDEQIAQGETPQEGDG